MQVMQKCVLPQEHTGKKIVFHSIAGHINANKALKLSQNSFSIFAVSASISDFVNNVSPGGVNARVNSRRVQD
jgi:hypothetical protein